MKHGTAARKQGPDIDKKNRNEFITVDLMGQMTYIRASLPSISHIGKWVLREKGIYQTTTSSRSEFPKRITVNP